MKIYRTIIAILFLLFIFSANAQRNFTQEADDAFDLQQYFEAIAKYKKAYAKVKKNRAEKARIKFRTAECYRMINDTKQAESWYKRVIKTRYPDPLVYLYYADALKANQNYEEAMVQYKKYKEKVPSDPRGENGIEACMLAQKWKTNPTRYEIENMKKFNSKENDFSPAYSDRRYKELLFTSSRENTSGRSYDAWTGQSFTDLFVVEKDRKGSWSLPVPFDNIINSEVNEGAACFDEKKKVIFFTRCNVERMKKLGCEIFTSEKKGTTWDEPKLIPVAADSFTVGHPSLSGDELILYFASDIPGGFGGKDIWMLKRTSKDASFSKCKPVNLGQVINTPGDEMFPFIRDANKDGQTELYFSSNYHIGMGGLDIFKSVKLGDNEWSTPNNMMAPLNSEGDDFAIIFEGIEEKGFFTSNRAGGRGGDDIWSFYLPPLIFTLQGIVRDDSTLQVIVGATVKLEGSDGSSIIDTTDATGLYSFDKTQILPNTSYELTVSKQGYFTERGKETTVGLDESKNLVHDFNLVPIPPIPIVLPEILYDLDKYDLKPEFRDSLNGLIRTLVENPTIVVELSSHTDFRASTEYNDVLSFNRAKSVVDYLKTQGIDPDRLVAKGYGERQPRVLRKDMMKRGILFKTGTVLTEDYITNTLKTTNEREAAHDLNRRTEFRVLRDNFVPKATIDTSKTNVINIIQDVNANTHPITITGDGKVEALCNINGKTKTFVYDENVKGISVSLDAAKDLMANQIIYKSDFKNAEKVLGVGEGIADHATFKIDELEIGDNIVNDVEIEVVYDLSSPIMIGKSFITAEIGNFTIDKEKKLIIFEK